MRGNKVSLGISTKLAKEVSSVQIRYNGCNSDESCGDEPACIWYELVDKANSPLFIWLKICPFLWANFYLNIFNKCLNMVKIVIQ